MPPKSVYQQRLRELMNERGIDYREAQKVYKAMKLKSESATTTQWDNTLPYQSPPSLKSSTPSPSWIQNRNVYIAPELLEEPVISKEDFWKAHALKDEEQAQRNKLSLEKQRLEQQQQREQEELEREDQLHQQQMQKQELLQEQRRLREEQRQIALEQQRIKDLRKQVVLDKQNLQEQRRRYVEAKTVDEEQDVSPVVIEDTAQQIVDLISEYLATKYLTTWDQLYGPNAIDPNRPRSWYKFGFGKTPGEVWTQLQLQARQQVVQVRQFLDSFQSSWWKQICVVKFQPKLEYELRRKLHREFAELDTRWRATKLLPQIRIIPTAYSYSELEHILRQILDIIDQASTESGYVHQSMCTSLGDEVVRQLDEWHTGLQNKLARV